MICAKLKTQCCILKLESEAQHVISKPVSHHMLSAAPSPHTHTLTHFCTPLLYFLSFKFPSHLLLLHSASSNTLVLFIPHFFPSHFTCSSLWMTVHFKNLSSPPGCLSRSDVVSWEEWRRCIHGSRWCSPQERNRGGKKQRGNRGLSKKAKRRARNERRRGNWGGRGGDWRRQMKRGNVRGERLMNECLCIPRRGQCQFTTPSKCFKLKWCLERGWRESSLIQSSPLFSSSNPSWGESEKHQNKLRLFNHYPSDYLHTGATLHRSAAK